MGSRPSKADSVAGRELASGGVDVVVVEVREAEPNDC